MHRVDGIEQVANLIVCRHGSHAEETRCIIAPLLPLHVALMGQKGGGLREKDRKCANGRIADLILHIFPSSIIWQRFKGGLYHFEQALE